jgi:DNA-binding NarL/FixJ family response regulator
VLADNGTHDDAADGRLPGALDRDAVSGSGLRVVVADDDVLLREGLASLLERSGMQVVGQAGDGAQLLALVAECAPDLVVVDVRMPPSRTTEGLDAARQIREQHPEIGILVLSAHADVEQAMELLATGRAVGYLLKNRVIDMAEFVDTVDRIAKGDRSSIPCWCRSWSWPADARIRLAG